MECILESLSADFSQGSQRVRNRVGNLDFFSKGPTLKSELLCVRIFWDAVVEQFEEYKDFFENIFPWIMFTMHVIFKGVYYPRGYTFNLKHKS